MNNGTKLRTALGIAVSLHTAIMATDVTGFSNPTIDYVYKVVSVILNLIVIALNTYYNNDYTEAASIGTGITRQIKAEQEDAYMGDRFYISEDEENPDEQ